MRLGSLMEGLAAARQGHAEERPRLAFARFQRVSPLRTLIAEAAPLVALWAEAGVADAVGSRSSAPTRIWLGLAMLGLTARSSGQRLPRPRFCSASFQRESPRCTLTVFGVATCVTTFAELAAGCGWAGRIDDTGAEGCAGFGGAGGSIG